MNVLEQARAWVSEDPDPETRRELQALVDAQSFDELDARFSGPLAFGTAGLRGMLGAGPSRMNRVTVQRSTAGLCAWLRATVPGATERGICVGRDARTKSDVFAKDVIEVALGAGFRVFFFADVVPTPIVAFSLLELRAAAGVVITASHNPREYSGYKVFWGNGAQIVPPNDRGIAAAIAAAPPVRDLARMSVDEGRERARLREIDPMIERYIEVVSGSVDFEAPRRPVRVAYTALHGVAETPLRKLVACATDCRFESVPEQSAPDAAFPTVDFPNPEEPGAMDRVRALAARNQADLALANDPDGDRLAVAVRDGDTYAPLSGNDLGLLLAEDLLSRTTGAGIPLVLSTIVSSPVLGAVAASHGARWEQTLTGHKWIHNRAIELEREGYRYVFGYEEALGYAPLKAVRDKDGLSSALLVIDLASRLSAGGRTLLDALESLHARHGFFRDAQRSLWFDGPRADREMAARVDAMRAEPPRSIGGRKVEAFIDLARQTRWTPEGEAPYAGPGYSNLLIFKLDGGHQVMVRPSGTEPKLKYYLYAQSDVGEPQATARRDVRALIRAMLVDLGLDPDFQ